MKDSSYLFEYVAEFARSLRRGMTPAARRAFYDGIRNLLEGVDDKAKKECALERLKRIEVFDLNAHDPSGKSLSESVEEFAQWLERNNV